MGFRLNVPTINLAIEPDAVPGGLAAWGDGNLEVQVRGDVDLDTFFGLVDRLGTLPNDPREFDGSQASRMKSAFSDFAELVVGWNIEDVECTPANFRKLPFPLCIAVFSAWASAARLDR